MHRRCVMSAQLGRTQQGMGRCALLAMLARLTWTVMHRHRAVGVVWVSTRMVAMRAAPHVLLVVQTWTLMHRHAALFVVLERTPLAVALLAMIAALVRPTWTAMPRLPVMTAHLVTMLLLG